MSFSSALHCFITLFLELDSIRRYFMKKVLGFTLLTIILFSTPACKKSCGVAPNATQLYKKNNKCFYYSEDDQGNKVKVNYPCDYCSH